MNKKLIRLEIIGFIAVSVVGTLLHFVYDWSGKLAIIGLIAPINESPWEHLKLLFFPFFAYTIFEVVKLKQNKFNVFFANYIAIILGMYVTLSFFYTYIGIIGKENSFLSILSFFIGVAVAFITSYALINNSVGVGMPNAIALAMFIITSILFFVFTFSPPFIPLFQDPQNLTYGI
jgi:hypothetical protein